MYPRCISPGRKYLHPDSKLIAITNGIYRWRWTTASWDGEPLTYDDAKFWAIHSENRHRLLEHVHQQTGDELNPDALTVVWARRMAAYKRPELLVSDLGQLGKLINDSDRPVQIIVAGVRVSRLLVDMLQKAVPIFAMS